MYRSRDRGRPGRPGRRNSCLFCTESEFLLSFLIWDFGFVGTLEWVIGIGDSGKRRRLAGKNAS